MPMRFILPAAAALMISAALPAIAENHAPDALIVQSASASVADTVEKFVTILESKGATVFAVVDHAAGAEKAGMELPPATLVIFGNPKIGTPLMQSAPQMGLDLPLRVLFRDAGDGSTEIVYRDIGAVAAAHGVPADTAALGKATKALAGLTGAVAD